MHQCDNARVAPQGSIGAGNLDVCTELVTVLQWVVLRSSPQTLCTESDFSYSHEPGTSHPQPRRRVEGQPRRIYQREDCPPSFLLPRASTINWESRVCRAGCIDLQALRWILRDLYHAWGLFQPHRATFWLYLTPGHLQGRVQTSYSMPAPKWVRRDTLASRCLCTKGKDYRLAHALCLVISRAYRDRVQYLVVIPSVFRVT